MIQFGMKSTFVAFQDKYYEYDGDKLPKDRGLTIGAYESAWLADLVGTYIFKKSTEQFTNSIYHGMYRDDGFALFKGRLSFQAIKQWHTDFQNRVNELAGGDFLQYTVEVWADPQLQPMQSTDDDPNITVTNKMEFPYLDLALFWNNNTLQTKVHLKQNQKLQYLNKGSTHTPSCFKAIPHGVFHRLAKLTMMTDDNAMEKLDNLYPLHVKALRQANLIDDRSMPTIPTLKEAKQLYPPISLT